MTEVTVNCEPKVRICYKMTSKGKVYWEITGRGDNVDDAMKFVVEADKKMAEQFKGRAVTEMDDGRD